MKSIYAAMTSISLLLFSHSQLLAQQISFFSERTYPIKSINVLKYEMIILNHAFEQMGIKPNVKDDGIFVYSPPVFALDDEKTSKIGSLNKITASGKLYLTDLICASNMLLPRPVGLLRVDTMDTIRQFIRPETNYRIIRQMSAESCFNISINTNPNPITPATWSSVARFSVNESSLGKFVFVWTNDIDALAVLYI